MKLQITLLFLALSLCAAAQTLTTNVPGVTLSGPLNDLTITNTSAKSVVIARVLYYGADGQKKDGHQRMFLLDRPNYLAVGDSEKLGTFHKGQGAEGIASAKVAAVIFADGEYQGPDDRDATNFRQNIEVVFRSFRTTFQLAQAGKWDEVQAWYDKDTHGDVWKAAAASRLLRNRDEGGDVQRYKHYANLPDKTWKGSALLNKLMTVPGLQEIAKWFAPLAVYAQNHTFCCTAPWPQSGTDDYRATQWTYYCSDTNPDIPCPANFDPTPWIGITATCTAIPPAFAYTTGMELQLAQDLQGHTWFQMDAGSQTTPDYRLTGTASCHDLRMFGYQPEYASYYKFCEDVTTLPPEKLADTTQYICGASKTGYSS